VKETFYDPLNEFLNERPFFQFVADQLKEKDLNPPE